MEIASAVEGSSIITFWKRCSSALSRSEILLVFVEASSRRMVELTPSAGPALRMLGSIHGTPHPLPAPMRVRISSMKSEYLAFGSSHP